MTKEATNKQEGDFEDLFEDDVFAETEQTAEEEVLASKGEAQLSEGPSAGKSDSTKYMIYGVGGLVFMGLCWAVYRQFVPAAPTHVQHKQGPTRVLKVNHTRPQLYKKKVEKPKVEKPKVDAGFVINKKNLKQMISGFTTSTNNALHDTQKQLDNRMDVMQSSFDKTYQNTQKEFSQVDQQLNLLAHQQINLAKMQKQQQQQEVGSVNVMLKDQNKKMDLLTKKIDSLGTQFASMNKTLAVVNQSIVKTQVELKLVIAEKAAEAQKMTLRAVVPGRAWLVNGKGQTLTISVGNELPYYGKVLKIDSKANTVTMSTGYVFS
jgi:hypothetical protein